MPRADHTVEIARPPADVFPYLTEPEKMKRWIGGLVEFTPLDEGAGLGSRSRQRVELGGRTWDVESEIVELEENRRLAARMQASAFTSTVSYDLNEAAGGTRLTGVVDIELRGMGGRLLGGFVRGQAEQKLVGDLGRLKQVVETETP